jgi:hypothetical protein
MSIILGKLIFFTMYKGLINSMNHCNRNIGSKAKFLRKYISFFSLYIEWTCNQFQKSTNSFFV